MSAPPSQSPVPAVLPELLERRLVIVTGKGGTGKTTVSAALGLAAAARGHNVLLAEMADDEALTPLLAPGRAAVGYAGRELAPRLRVMHIDPYAALAEYLGLQLPVQRMAESVLRNRAFRQLMEASPGWRELITLGKLWHLEQMRERDGRPRYDLIVVDAPATGHGVAFLNVPKVVASAVRAGPLRRHSQAVEELLEDPKRTLVLPVALAEELPVRETAELVEQVRTEVGIAVDRVVVNAVATPPFPPGLEKLDDDIGRLPADARFGSLPPAGVLAACAGFLRARHELNRSYLEELRELTGLPLVVLPALGEAAGERAGLERLGALLVPPAKGDG
jgi:anion-transporting  ArsA/GET3 family ATPase